MITKEQLDKINALLDKHNDEVEVEGCIVNPHYDILSFKRKDNEIIVVVDDMEECDIEEMPITIFSKEDIDDMINCATDY